MEPPEGVWIGIERLVQFCLDREAASLRYCRCLCRRFEQMPEEVVSPQASPDTGIVSEEVMEVVHQALERLPEEFRQAWEMRHILGRSYAEIAEVLDTNSNTVRTRIFRANERLREDPSVAALLDR
jgi:RNA polymerase sigma factor (sigma-70 family)